MGDVNMPSEQAIALFTNVFGYAPDPEALHAGECWQVERIDAALRRAKAEGLDEALKLCAVIENHYATKGKNVQVSDIQRHAVIGVRQSILDRIAELGQHAHTEPPSCLWTYDDIDDCYNTGCGNAYCLVDGTLEENDHKYCPYCGGPIQEDARAAQIDEGHDEI